MIRQPLFLIPSQCLDRIELCGFSGPKIAEDTRQKNTPESDAIGATVKITRQAAIAEVAKPPPRPTTTPAKPPMKQTITASVRN